MNLTVGMFKRLEIWYFSGRYELRQRITRLWEQRIHPISDYWNSIQKLFIQTSHLSNSTDNFHFYGCTCVRRIISKSGKTIGMLYSGSSLSGRLIFVVGFDFLVGSPTAKQWLLRTVFAGLPENSILDWFGWGSVSFCEFLFGTIKHHRHRILQKDMATGESSLFFPFLSFSQIYPQNGESICLGSILIFIWEMNGSKQGWLVTP